MEEPKLNENKKEVEIEEERKVVENKNSFAFNLIEAINHDFLNYMVVTSKTQAAIRSEQHSFGSGKTTYALQVSVRMHHPDYEDVLYHRDGYENWEPPEDPEDDLWKNTFKDMVYNPCDLRDNFFMPGHERIRFGVADDLQVTCPRTKGVPKFVVLIVGEATAARPEVSNVCITTPSILSLAAPLRTLPEFEIIIPKRGWYEIQRTVRSKVFDNPEADQGRLVPVEIGQFKDLPPLVKKKYNEWRVKQKIYLKSPEYSKRFKRLQRESEGMLEMKDDVKDKPLTMDERIDKMRQQGWKGSQADGRLYLKAAMGILE